jgi:hypothetical protein
MKVALVVAAIAAWPSCALSQTHHFHGNIATWSGVPPYPASATRHKTETNSAFCTAADAANHWGFFWSSEPVCLAWLAEMRELSNRGPTPYEVHSYWVTECWKRAGMVVSPDPDSLRAAGQGCEEAVSQREYEQNRAGAAASVAEELGHSPP